MDVIVIGDLIHDEYVFGRSERICPEAPVPVIIPETESSTEGGAGLVTKQLTELLRHNSVYYMYGSQSYKKRIFVGNHLVCRLDRDSVDEMDEPNLYAKRVIYRLHEYNPKVLVVSDYGKGSFTEDSAKRIKEAADSLNIPVFVDAKHNWHWWEGVFAKFPNQREHHMVGTAKYIIFKLGAGGCSVSSSLKNIIPVPLDRISEVKDCTGAGDTFLAAFVAYYIRKSKDMVECAKFANRIASESVEHLGTFVVDKPEGIW